MSMYAYKDAARTQDISAKEAQVQDKGTRFYCPNPLCDAHLYIANLDGLRSPYFTANRKEHPHVEDCDCRKAAKVFSPNNFKEEGFVLEDVISELMQIEEDSTGGVAPHKSHSQGSITPQVPHTISQIYWMCKTYSCRDTYNSIPIGMILLDKRSFYMYSKGVFGHHLIEAYCKSRYFDPEGFGIIFLELSHEETTYSFVLEFQDKVLFRSVERRLRNNRNRRIVIAGRWSKYSKYNFFSTLITSKKQITVI